MTGILKDVMREQADAHASPHFDAGAIAAAGDRRARRGRAAVGSLAVAAVTLAAIGLPRLLDGAGTTGADGGPVAGQGREVVGGAFAERRPTYAVDDVIHWGTRSFPVGATITSFVQTDDGFVYATRNGDVWLFDGTDSERVGHSQNLRLHADDSGSLVAWVGSAEDGRTQYVVYDTSSRTEAARVDDIAAGASQEAEDQGAEVFAVDDAKAYWRTDEGLVRYDVATGGTDVLARSKAVTDPAHKPPRIIEITDVANGLFAYRDFEPNGGSGPIRISSDLENQAPALPSGYTGYLSPSAGYIATDQADDAKVYDTATREDVTPSVDGYEFAAVYAWLDDSRLTMIAIEKLGGRQPIDILECTVPKGACTVAADDVAVYDEKAAPSLALPVGERLGD